MVLVEEIKSQGLITSTIGRWGTPQRNHYKGKIIKPVKACSHYRVRLARDGSATTKCVHQLVLEAFLSYTVRMSALRP